MRWGSIINNWDFTSKFDKNCSKMLFAEICFEKRFSRHIVNEIFSAWLTGLFTGFDKMTRLQSVFCYHHIAGTTQSLASHVISSCIDVLFTADNTRSFKSCKVLHVSTKSSGSRYNILFMEMNGSFPNYWSLSQEASSSLPTQLSITRNFYFSWCNYISQFFFRKCRSDTFLNMRTSRDFTESNKSFSQVVSQNFLYAVKLIFEQLPRM